MTELVDLLQHGYSAWGAALDYVSNNESALAPVGDDQVPDPPDMGVANEVLASVRQMNRDAGIPDAPESYDIKDDGYQIRLDDGAWVPRASGQRPAGVSTTTDSG
ncbi:MAG: hypothetical protein QM572_18175 [Nocardioides sp.]|uniref:hypothetical protein n=1 Tax=Nocardioides sp. TaxID=35761 RepID=UPI0039E282AA